MIDLTAFSTAEMIATVATSRASGAFGTYSNMGFGRCIVTVRGIVAAVSTDAHGWLVAIGNGRHFVASDADLEVAAQMALDAR